MNKRYPILETNLTTVKNNARVMCDLCKGQGIDVAGVIKFSDGDINISKAYKDGGCKQLASSRIIHLKKIKENMPSVTTMLIRIPMMSETEDVVLWSDISLNSEEGVLRKLDEMARKHNMKHGVLLMYDVGDRREGVVDEDRLFDMAMLVENRLDNLWLAGVGSSFACASGVLPDWDNLTQLAEMARRIEAAIGRKLDIVSGGSSITLTLLAKGRSLPEGINHLRIGGAIANPMGIRVNRDVEIEGMCEDAFKLIAEVVEVGEKSSPIGSSGKNWAGQEVSFEDRGVRKRAIIALGSQDIGDPKSLIPIDEDVEVVCGSSDHTILDVTNSLKEWNAGDKMEFRVFYMPLLYAFSTEHVAVEYVK